MEELFKQFVTERKYLKNVTPKTEDWYWQSWKSFGHLALSSPDKLPGKAEWAKAISALRDRGVSAVSVNTWARAINAFLNWAHEEQHLPKLERIPRLKEDRNLLATLTTEQLRHLLSFRPKTFREHRLFAMLCLMLDTGIRADEALSLNRGAIDLENLLVTITGKGRKQRKVPITLELRKVVFRWLSKHSHSLVFPTRDGAKQIQRNALRDFKMLGKRLGLTGVRVSFHTLRHTFAVSYLRRGGNLFYLSRILGHSDISTTQVYLRSTGIEDLQNAHTGMSLLG